MLRSPLRARGWEKPRCGAVSDEAGEFWGVVTRCGTYAIRQSNDGGGQDKDQFGGQPFGTDGHRIYHSAKAQNPAGSVMSLMRYCPAIRQRYSAVRLSRHVGHCNRNRRHGLHRMRRFVQRGYGQKGQHQHNAQGVRPNRDRTRVFHATKVVVAEGNDKPSLAY